jgi:hypothetical protein
VRRDLGEARHYPRVGEGPSQPSSGSTGLGRRLEDHTHG